ncbi:hypothetical protein, partial [Atopomonas hussainii]|uniref:hypothetical protein n=1 Tax=Atopomonas hussainii TaxID=1429083 RepID=UPI000A5915D4
MDEVANNYFRKSSLRRFGSFRLGLACDSTATTGHPNNALNAAHFVRWTVKSCAFACPLA